MKKFFSEVGPVMVFVCIILGLIYGAIKLGELLIPRIGIVEGVIITVGAFILSVIVVMQGMDTLDL